MWKQSITLAVALACTPLLLSAFEDDSKSKALGMKATAKGAAASAVLSKSASKQERATRAQIRAFRQQLEELRARLARNESARKRIAQQLEESLDLLEKSIAREARHNCSPSRRLLTYYQWFDRNGHDKRAKRTLAHSVREYRGNHRRILSAARSLMTDRKTAGKYDRAALALTEMVSKQQRSFDHRDLDTTALAMFLNGQPEKAVELQRQALAKVRDSSDYRRRLRTYEVALSTMQDQAGLATLAKKKVDANKGPSVVSRVADDD